MAEKSLSSLTRDLRVLYTRGNDALVRDNFDYAIDLFCQVLTKEPALYEVRNALRVAQLKRAGKGAGFFKKMLGAAGSSGSASSSPSKSRVSWTTGWINDPLIPDI